MNNDQKVRFLDMVEDLIEQGHSVERTQFRSHYVGNPLYVETESFFSWWGKVMSLGHQLGAAARPWSILFNANPDTKLGTTKFVLGILQAIRSEIEKDHLKTVTQLVKAETLTDLLEQGEHLFDNGYHLAAGVIGRAVLEEHLRSICDSLECAPEKERPTLNDFNQSLYKVDHYNKIKMKQIDTLAAIGNEAAHNKPGLNATDIKKLLTDLPSILDSTGV
jgi:hypothetical protein